MTLCDFYASAGDLSPEAFYLCTLCVCLIRFVDTISYEPLVGTSQNLQLGTPMNGLDLEVKRSKVKVMTRSNKHFGSHFITCLQKYKCVLMQLRTVNDYHIQMTRRHFDGHGFESQCHKTYSAGHTD